MLKANIIKKLEEILPNIRTDSDIRDFCEENRVSMKEVYEYIAYLTVPECCKNCKNKVFFPNMYPCHSCSRVPREDCFEATE